MHPLARVAILLFLLAHTGLAHIVKRDYQVPEYTGNSDYNTNQVYEVYDPQEYDEDKEYKIAKVIKGALTGYPIINVIIAGMLLGALNFLFPSIVTITQNTNNPIGRRKRSLPDDDNEDLKTRIQNIFMAVVQSEECMEKVICEVQALAGEQYKDYIHSLAKKFTPTRFAKYLQAFKEGKNSVHCKQRKCTLVSQE